MPATATISPDAISEALLARLADPLCVKTRGLAADLAKQFNVAPQTIRNYLQDMLGDAYKSNDPAAWRAKLDVSDMPRDPLAYTPPPFADEHQRNLERSRAEYRAEAQALLCRLITEPLPKTRTRRRAVKANAKNRVYRITIRYFASLVIDPTPKMSHCKADLGNIQTHPRFCQKPKNLADLGGDVRIVCFALGMPMLSLGALIAAIWRLSGEAYGVLSLTVAIIVTLSIVTWQTG